MINLLLLFYIYSKHLSVILSVQELMLVVVALKNDNRSLTWDECSECQQGYSMFHNKYITRGPGALTLVNSIAKYQPQMCQRMYIYALKCNIMKIKYV